MTPATYGPQGKGHQVLARLEEGPATLAELCDLLGVNGRPTPRKKVWFLLGRMLRDGFALFDLGDYSITDRGLWALDTLNAGQEVHTGEAVPSVRVFVRDLAA